MGVGGNLEGTTKFGGKNMFRAPEGNGMPAPKEELHKLVEKEDPMVDDRLKALLKEDRKRKKKKKDKKKKKKKDKKKKKKKKASSSSSDSSDSDSDGSVDKGAKVVVEEPKPKRQKGLAPFTVY